MHHERTLNWSIGVWAMVTIFAREWLERHVPLLHWFFVLVFLVLLVWSLSIALRRLTVPDAGNPFPHRQLQVGDFLRIFFVLWAGHAALATRHLLGFYAFSVIATLLTFFLITIISIEVFRRRGINGWVIGCGLFLYFLLS